MQHQNEILQQYIGFLKTPDLLLNEILIPYPNLKLKTEKFHIKSSLSEATLNELTKQLYLGKRVELFFKEWLTFYPEAKLLAFSLQIIQEKKTLGEFDFLWKFKNQYQHTELVYKQYIFIKGFGKDELSSWVGPNKKDLLHLKLKKLEKHQFPLLFHAAAEESLRQKFNLRAKDFQQNLCFKAQLFLHYTEKQNAFTGINPNAILGKWYYFKEFCKQSFEAFSFAIIPKKNWPIIPEDFSWISWDSFPEIILKLAASTQEKRSVKVWMKTPKRLHQLFVIWESDEDT